MRMRKLVLFLFVSIALSAQQIEHHTYQRKGFPVRTAWENFTPATCMVPLTLDKKGEGTITYATDFTPVVCKRSDDQSFVAPKNFVQVPVACYVDENTRDKTVRFFQVFLPTKDGSMVEDEDENHIHIGTDPASPGMEVVYRCAMAVPK
jgi:hypothetical protein